jgi:hypothetical protein
MKDLKFICAQPDDTYYTWQVHMWLESLKEIGQIHNAIVLVYTPQKRLFNDKWDQITKLYPEAEFNFYKDEQGDLSNLIGIYIPVLRPWLLWKYWSDRPEMSEHAVFYCDSDILWTDKFNIDEYIQDDVCYLSDTNSYINAQYFDSKVHQVLPEKLEEYKARDVLSEIGSVIGISRQLAEDNNENSGGAQYLLKNVDVSFWSKVMNDCILIRTYLQKINREFFKDENAGYQSWCADMWSVLWNLWVKDQETKVIPEMGFAWGPDPLTKLETHPIYHNAGIVATEQGGYPCFYKGKYHSGTNPMTDPHLDVVLNNEKSMKHCTGYYAKKLNELKIKYNLIY